MTFLHGKTHVSDEVSVFSIFPSMERDSGLQCRTTLLKGYWHKTLWCRIFLLQRVARCLLVITRHIVCCSTRWIINYRPLNIDQFQFRFERARKTWSRWVQLSPPSVCGSRPCQHTKLWHTSTRFASELLSNKKRDYSVAKHISFKACATSTNLRPAAEKYRLREHTWQKKNGGYDVIITCFIDCSVATWGK